jgi:replication initiation and membrane attachment protein
MELERMRITNLLHFSEYHRFYVVRDFALSSLDYKMLSSVYQPMIGAYAVSIYHTLFHQLPADKSGYSPVEQQRKLFLALELESGERGRKFFIEQTSKLEAVGLLKTSRRFAEASEDYVYEYTLLQPQTPGEFFKNQHLTLLLRDKVGKYMVFALRDELVLGASEELAEANSENLSVPFYELFTLNSQVIDFELEQAFFESAAAVPTESKPEVTYKGYQYAEIISHFPRSSMNRDFVENLKYEPEHMAQINFVAKKFNLYLTDVCKLLDEEGVFSPEGGVDMDLLQHKASMIFRQDRKRSEERTKLIGKLSETAEAPAKTKEQPVEMEFYLEVPDIFQGQCTQHQYNFILRNEPYRTLLEMIFSKGAIPSGLLDTLNVMNLEYGLPDAVLNVLIHFFYVNKRSWARSSIEYSVTDMLAKQVGSFEQAVEYIREQAKYQERKNSKAASGGGTGSGTGGKTGYGSRNRGTRQKPVLPVVEDAPGKKLSEAEREELRRMARLLDERK